MARLSQDVPNQPATFAEALQAVLDEGGISNRELARRLAGSRDEKEIAGRRRQIVRWLNGETPNPTRPTRIRVAQLLELDRDHFLTVPTPADAALARMADLDRRLTALEAGAEARLERLEGLLQELRNELPEPRSDRRAPRGKRGTGR